MKKILIIIFAIVIPVLLCILYYNYKEAESDWSVQCGLYKLTGLFCPGCGGQRAFHNLLHGHFLKAFRYNILFVVAIPFFVYLYYILVQVYGLGNKEYANGLLFSPRFAKIFLIVLVVFFIIRNIPCFPFTYLSPL